MNKTNTICVTVLCVTLLVLVILYSMEYISIYILLLVTLPIVKTVDSMLPDDGIDIKKGLIYIGKLILTIFTTVL